MLREYTGAKEATHRWKMNLIKKKEKMKEEKLQTKKSLSFEAASRVETLLIYSTNLLVTLHLLHKLLILLCLIFTIALMVISIYFVSADNTWSLGLISLCFAFASRVSRKNILQEHQNDILREKTIVTTTKSRYSIQDLTFCITVMRLAGEEILLH